MVIRFSALILGLGFLIFASACALRAGEAPPEDVDKAAALFFQRLQGAEYDSIFDDAASQFKQQKPRAVMVEDLKAMASRGRVGNFTRLEMIFGTEGDNRVSLPLYTVDFDGVPKQVSFKFVDQSGEWKLLAFSLTERGTGA